MGDKNWSKMVLLTSLAICSISLGSPVAEAEAVSRYGRGYSGFRGFGLSSRTPRVYSGPYNRGYRGRYNSDRHGYHSAPKKHHQHILSSPLSQHRVGVVAAEEVDRFIPADAKQAGQKLFIEDSVPTLGIKEQVVNPSFSAQIDCNDDARDIISEPFTNSVDNIMPIQQSEPEDLVFNFPEVPPVQKPSNINNNIVMESTDTVAGASSVSATQQRLIDQILRQKQQQAQEIDNILNANNEVEEIIIQDIPEQQNSQSSNPAQFIPAQSFKFPPRIPPEAPVPPPVKQQLSVQPQAPNLSLPVLPQAIPAVPGRPVLADNSVNLNAVQTVQQSRFIPMPVPAVPSLSN